MKIKRFFILFMCSFFSLSVGCINKSNKEIVDAYQENGGKNFNYLCGIDQFGRSVNPITGKDDKKNVGVFYSLWHGESVTTTYNIRELLEENPDKLFDLKGSKDSPLNSFHYWDEPIYGYYRSDDKWVIAKHCELLTQAGIDFLLFDATNSYIYKDAYMALLEVFDEYQKLGWDVPKIAFYTNSKSIVTMNSLYEHLYSKGIYENLWYKPDGEHPLIIGALCAKNDIKMLRDEGYTYEYNPPELSEEFLEFFDLRSSQWPYNTVNPGGFPWMEWEYPQANHRGVMSVSLAQHPHLPFSNSWFNRGLNMGRGYDFDKKENKKMEAAKGLNAQYQWDTVHKNADKVHTVLVTGWNEWAAIKLNVQDKVGFIDCFNEEFSRDIEPAKNGTYEDAFYLQLVENIRQYKGYRESFKSPDMMTINLNGDLSEWEKIRNSYYNVGEITRERNSISVDRKYRYKADPVPNVIKEVKVTHDSESIYFIIYCEDDIIGTENKNWMNIFIGTGQLKEQGWNGYNYLIGESRSSDMIAISSLDTSGKATKFSEHPYRLYKNTLQIKISINDLGLNSKDQGFYFKVADGVEKTKEIMDYYVTGHSFPMGRMSLYYFMN